MAGKGVRRRQVHVHAAVSAGWRYTADPDTHQGRARLVRLDAAATAMMCRASFVPIVYRLDDVHIVTGAVSAHKEFGLTVSFGGTTWRAHVGYPDLDSPRSLGLHSSPVCAHSLSCGHDPYCASWGAA